MPDSQSSACPECNAPLVEAARFCAHCGRRLTEGSVADNVDPYLGIVVAQRYRLDELIGTGASCRVYRATQISLGKAFAVKVLNTRLESDESWHDNFANEARNAAKLNHPNIVSIVDYGRIEDGPSYVVMELVDGRTLQSVIERERPLACARTIDLSLQILAALTEAHSLGVIHRDLKPDNIVVQQLRSHGEHLKVLDFGIATTLVERDRDPITTASDTGVRMYGTPEYMAPEQIRGGSIGPTTDIYAAGTILYQLLTGQVPFAGSAPPQTLLRQCDEVPKDPRAHDSSIPEPLAQICLQALAKRPGDRLPTAQAFRDALISLGQDQRPTHLPCPQCGARIQAGQRFCVQCGLHLASASYTPTREADAEDGGRTSLQFRPSPLGQKGQPQSPQFVARGPQIDQISKILDDDRPGTRALILAAEPGAGKTRLLREAARVARLRGATVLTVEPESSGAAPPLEPIRQAVAAALGLDPATMTTRKLGRESNLLGVPVEALPGLTELFGLRGPIAGAEYAVRRRECMASAIQALQHAGRKSHLLLIFEDADAYDRATLTIVQSISTRQTDVAISVLIAWGGPADPPMTGELVSLEPLNLQEANALTSHVNGEVRSSLTSFIEKHAPLLPGHLACVIDAANSKHGDSLDFDSAEWTSSWIGQLEPTERWLLQVASILGLRWTKDDARELFGHDARPEDAKADFDTTLARLFEQGLLTTTERREMTFGHERLRRDLHATLDEGVRKSLHWAAAERCEYASSNVAVKAMHMSASQSPAAVGLLDEAATHAASGFDDERATRLLIRAITLLDGETGPVAEAQRVSLTCKLAQSLGFAGRHSAAVQQLEDAQRRCSDVLLRAQISRALGRAYLQTDQSSKAVAATRSALAVATASGDRERELELHRELGRALTAANSEREALQELLEGLDLYTLGEGPRAAVDVDLWRYLMQVSATMRSVGRQREAGIWAEHALFQAERRGQLLGILRANTHLAEIMRKQDKTELSERYLAQALEHAKYFGDRKTTAELLLARAELPHLARAPEERRRYLEQARELAEVIGWEQGREQASASLSAIPTRMIIAS